MSIYDKASLVLIPSGTKTSKVYSQKPVNGDGDFTFSRSTAATRVNADGNIEKETQNSLRNSNTFNSIWSASVATITGGESGYDGTNDAWLLSKTGNAYGSIYQTNTLSTGVWNISVYMKAGTNNKGSIRLSTGGANDIRRQVNLTTGAIATASASTANPIAESATDVGNGWWRFSFCGYMVTSTITINIYAGDTADTTGNIYIQDAQLEQGLVARDYIETTTAAVEGGITDNVPRLDYTDSSCPALLLEPQRTNIFLTSEWFGVWDLNAGTTLTYNYATSPEGVQNATRYVGTGASGFGDKFTLTSGTQYTISAYVKSNTGATQYCRLIGDSSNISSDLEVTTEWTRIYYTWTSGGLSNKTNGIFRDSSNNDIDILVYGLQLEQGSYATSYIPTYGTSVTRSAEPNAMDKVDLISDNFFSSNQLTWFMDVNLFERDGGSTVAPRLISSSNSQVFIGFNESLGNKLTIRHKDGSTPANTSGVDFDENGQRFKVLVKINGTTGEAFINGSSMGTFTTLAASNYDVFDNTQNNPYNFNQLLLFPTALSNEEAIALTTI